MIRKKYATRPSLLSMFALAMCFTVQAAHASTVVVGTCKTGIQFATIQAAVNAAPIGATIDVCPGTYPEQITITKKLTVVGIASGQNDAAVVVAPAGGVVVNATDIFGFPTAAQIFVQGATSVTISHLTVDGSANGLSGCATDSRSGGPGLSGRFGNQCREHYRNPRNHHFKQFRPQL